MRPLLILLLVPPLQEGRAREVVHDERRAVEIRLLVADANRHAACVIAFPEDSIEAIVASWNEGDLSLERRRENLFVKLLKKAEGDLHIVGASGTLYRLYLKPVEADADARVRIVKPAEAKRTKVASLELVRAMRRGAAPEWAAVRGCNVNIGTAMGCEFTAKLVYDAAHHSGFVIEVVNRTKAPVHIDPSRIVARDLILVGSRETVIQAGERSLMYAVFWR